MDKVLGVSSLHHISSVKPGAWGPSPQKQRQEVAWATEGPNLKNKLPEIVAGD